MSNYFRWNAGRKRQGTPTLESQPGAHTGATRKYIPGYSDSNIVFLNTSTGNDANTGASIAQALLTYSAAATAAGTTKKIRLVNSATLTANITKPTEATIGTTSTIASASMTAPVNVWTQAGTPSFGGSAIYAVAWAEGLSKFISGGGTIAYSSDGDTWTQAASGTATAVKWVPDLEIAIAVQGRYIKTSTDANTWSTVYTAPVTNNGFRDIVYSKALGILVAVGDNAIQDISQANILNSSDGGTTWYPVSDTSYGQNSPVFCVTWSDELSLFVSGGLYGKIAYSSDGYTWTQAATPSFGTAVTNWIYSIAWSPSLAKFVAVGGAGEIAYSTDGNTWTQAGTPSFGASNVNKVEWCPEIEKFVAVGASGKIAYSSDGNTWTQAGTPSFGADTINAVAYSPLLGRVVAVAGAGKIARSTAFATTISAAVAGFSIQAVQYSGTVTAYNCTLKQPGTTAALSLDACRVTERGAHISNNAVTVTATLVGGDIHYTGVYAAANALDLNLNTIAGTLYIYNGSTTNYERIRDNIIENGVQSSYPVTVTSGNTRGTSSDGTIFGQFCTTSDPLFVDTTDYKLQRVLDGYQYDSPMVAASQYYYNQATTQTFRDNGAWSYNESAATYKYQRTFDFLMPATAIGSAIDFVRHNRANLHVAEDGTPDAVNTPDSRWEEIVMQFKTLPADHIDFINWLEGQVDMTCDISLSPSLTPTTAVTASGATSAGEAVITITDNSGLDSGDQLTIDGNTYTVLYTYGTTKVVLDRVTTTALTDTESITVKYDTGYGEYQYVPMLERRLSRWYETDENYLRGLQIRFARKLP